MKSVKKDFGGYICRNEKCVYRIKVDGKRDLCPFKGCIFSSKRGRRDEHKRA